MKRYTFLQHPFYYFLQHSEDVVNGLDKCIAVFYDAKNAYQKALMYDRKLIDLSVDDELLSEIRSSSKKANWMKPETLPFEATSIDDTQLTFDDEEQSSVLELRFKNPNDGGYDVLYFYFKNTIANFRLSTTNEVMAVTIKEVIQNLLYNQISLQLKAHYNNYNIHYKISKHIDFSSLQHETKRLKEEKYAQLKEMYHYLLQQLTSSETTEFVLSKTAIEKIYQLDLSLKEVNQVLNESIEILINKYQMGAIYEITEHDIIASSQYKEDQIASISRERLEKTTEFLNRYEHAAKLLKSKGKKITGINIGEACEPTISAAAISDILKKHRKKIIQLLNEHPDSWTTIRTYFRPIVTLVKTHQHQTQRIGA